MTKTFISFNPATEEKLIEYPGHSSIEVNDKLDQSVRAQKQWAHYSFAERARALRHIARTVRKRKNDYSFLITEEMGKPIMESLAEIEKCAWTCEHFADNGEKYLQPMNVKTDAKKSYVSYEPLGTILGIMPWNFPFWQFFRFAAPTLMAGNGIVLKHASNVPGCGMAIEQLFMDHDFPNGLVTTTLVDSKTALGMIDDPRIVGVSVTGSTSAGKQIAARAGMNVKKSVLELGGSDPFIVFSDVSSVQDCAHSAVRARTQNTGQSCIAAKRFIVMKKIALAFEGAMARAMDDLIMGDPLDKETQIGPLARSDLRENLVRQMAQSIRQGAQVRTTRKKSKGKGYFFPPTLLSKVKLSMPVFSEETFGPLAGVVSVDTAREAVELANHTPYGLGASLWTSDLKRAEELARHVESGSVFVNKIVASDPRIPFGGAKQSGLGKELGQLGIKEFVNAKIIWIN